MAVGGTLRHRWLSGLAAAVVVGSSTAALALPSSGEPVDSGPPPPQVAHLLHAPSGPGARIVDDLGRTVILRGVNVNGLGEYYQEWPDLPATLPLTEDDFRSIAAMGFNVVRLLVTWSRLEPEPGVIDTAYLDQIAQVVAWARAHDVYVLLDMHQDAWSPFVYTPDGVDCPDPLEPAVGWDGAPRWATALVGTVATCRLAAREVSLAVQTSFERFYLDVDGVQTHLVDVWAALAGRFAADPVIAGYDLLNEPNPGLTIGVSDYALLGVFYDRALQAIRAAETTAGGGVQHIGFFEPAVIAGPLPAPGPLPGFTADDNLVYAPHLYNESISILPGSIEDGFANAATAAAGYGTTFFAGEWGWFGDSDGDAPAIARYAAQEDAHLVGGTWWQWEQACGDPHAIGTRGTRPGCAGESPLSDGLVTRAASNTTILSRAYPRAAPGVLTSIAADVASGALTVTGRADEATGPADLWVPERCGVPAVSGTNVAPATVHEVSGGWRVTVPVAAPGEYGIYVTCGRTPPTPAPGGVAAPEPGTSGRLPATGSNLQVWPPAVVLFAFALLSWRLPGRPQPAGIGWIRRLRRRG